MICAMGINRSLSRAKSDTAKKVSTFEMDETIRVKHKGQGWLSGVSSAGWNENDTSYPKLSVSPIVS